MPAVMAERLMSTACTVSTAKQGIVFLAVTGHRGEYEMEWPVELVILSLLFWPNFRHQGGQCILDRSHRVKERDTEKMH